MGAVEAVTSIIDSLAWPAGLVVLGLIFKGPLGRLIDRVKAITAPGGWRADLGVASELAEAGAPPEAVEAANVKQNRVLTDSGSRLSPEARVLAAWESFSSVAFAAARLLPAVEADWMGLRRRYGSLAYLLRGLQQEKLLSPETAAAIHELRSLRNQVAHGTQVSEEESAEFEHTARVLAGTLDFAIKASKLRAESRTSQNSSAVASGDD